MHNIDALLQQTELFAGLCLPEIKQMRTCLGALAKEYAKGDYIFHVGTIASYVGIVLSGTAQVVRSDAFGNETIVTTLHKADMFGETFVCAGVDTLPVSVIANTHCNILLLNYRKLLESRQDTCPFKDVAIANMLRILAQKNLLLNQKIEVISGRTTREKLLSYLSMQSETLGSAHFTIPLNRQALADYLNVNRSALSAELGKLQKEGTLTFHKNEFTLLQQYKPS